MVIENDITSLLVFMYDISDNIGYITDYTEMIDSMEMMSGVIEMIHSLEIFDNTVMK